MAEANSLPLLSQYSDVYTRLHDGRLQCAQYGMDRVALNRFIVDAANSTTPQDPSELISMVDPDKVEQGGSIDQKLTACKQKLSELVALQEEVNTLQKVARESGITGGFLNIVGQASIQSPSDHGASVIHQLSALMGGTDLSASNSVIPGDSADATATTSMTGAANDELQGQASDASQDRPLQRLRELVVGNWQSLSVDVAVCFIASIFAIGLVN